ncbi:MAG: S-layer family protein, partial [Bradyrhizobium sp.]|uniref:beta strand repeat-containing protein n=1 Tax=Bradyrhizobium sp. TaxID=376 RepID=UPI0025BA3221
GTLTITNNSGATISGGTSGIVAVAGAVAVTNSGTIRGNGTYDGLDRLPDAGIIVAAGGTTITNSGTISGRSQGIGTALYFNPSTSQLEARAIGTTVTNLAGGTILGELTNAVRLVGGGTITNAGAITSQGASAVSMFAFTGQTLNGLTSIGTVTNQAGGTITGATRGIVLTGGGVVSNAGTITGGVAAGDGSNAAIIIQALSTQPGKTGTITNTGTLTGFRGVLLASALSSAEITNSATITGQGNAGIQNDSVGLATIRNEFGASITGVTSGVVANGGAVAITNAGTIRGTGTYDGFDRAPDGGVLIAAAGSSVSNSGTISGARFGISTASFFNPSANRLEGRAIGTTITNSAGATIQGDTDDGVRLIGGGTVTNSGIIRGAAQNPTATTDGVSMFGFDGQTPAAGQTTLGSVSNLIGGQIIGQRHGILLTGGGSVTNGGTISAGNTAVFIQALSTEAGRTAAIANSGTLTGASGVTVGGAIASSTLTNSATITGTSAVGVTNGGAGVMTMSNTLTGRITGATSGVLASTGGIVLTNAGTIRGNGTFDGLDRTPDAGVMVTAAGTVITNTGTISGAAQGIGTAMLFNPATSRLEALAIGTEVINRSTGTIRGEATNAIRLVGGGAVTNAGTITSQGASAISMFAFEGQNLTGRTSIGTVTNQIGGRITGLTRGIVLTGGGVVSNAGTITGGSTAGDGSNAAIIIQGLSTQPASTATISNSGTLLGFRGVFLAATLASGSLTNSASISGQGSSGVQNDSSGLLTITNQGFGSISGATSGIVAGAGAIALTNAGNIRGNGTSTGSGTQAPDAGVLVTQVGSSITNSGTISGNQSGVSTASLFVAGVAQARATNTVVNNSGSIIGDNDDGVRLLGGGSVTNSGTIRGTAGSQTDGVQMSNLAGQTTTGQAEIGSVTNERTGIIDGQRWGVFLIGGGTVTNDGTISGAKLASATGGVGGVLIATGTGQTGKSATLTNSGTINGLVELTTSRNTLSNSGTIAGAVNLGTGAEGSVGSSVLNNRGVINGAVTFGAGDDVYNFFSGAQQNGIANGGGGTNTLALQLGVATSQRLDGSQFINFQRLEQLSQGSITLFFSGAVTFSNIGASNGGTVNLDSGTVQNVSLGTGSTATLGSSATVATTTDGATAVSVTGSSSTI